MKTLSDNVLDYLRRYAPDSLSFWTEEGSEAAPDVLSVCDTLYSLKLIGGMHLLARDSASRFAGRLSGYSLAGDIGKGKGPPLGVHKTAYALGVLNLLAEYGQAVQRQALREQDWQQHQLLDHRLRPRWPWYFTHHAWRVGHWIGGIPAIVASLWRLAPDLAERNSLPPPAAVLDSSDALIDQRTGLFRAYKMEAVQRAFRILYRFRHDPDAGDLGGIAHLHWGNYAAGRLPYKAAPALFDRTWALLQRRPFMESVPYCLDFDIVHLARTSIPDGDEREGPLRERVRDYANDIAGFYHDKLDEDYDLHKLPGGLAALHECALTAGQRAVPGLGVAPVDVAREACWI
ncbi:MAG TPA: hypothetical protein VHC40_10945 [Rhizomicrobium sp.]|jgi:hypothetical protein|nr:hypothetical protein [Rhizomicrobium sp.]